jgi:lysyl-tRNA synthetase class 2
MAEGRTERQIIDDRRKKAEELRALGQNPFPNDIRPPHLTRDVPRDGLPGEAELVPTAPVYQVAGRIVALRSFGKAAFAKVRDRAGAAHEVQVYIKKDLVGEQAFEMWKRVDPGDHIWAEGPAFKTKTGEASVRAQRFGIVTKALRPPAEKWHGLTDIETRYRQRYLDLVENPDVAEVFRKRARMISAIRRYLDGQDYLEVETPILSFSRGGALARPFVTHHNALGLDLYLRIALELPLKRLVVGGFDRVYEIGRVFRNEGMDKNHLPEFTMLESYEAYATYEDVMVRTEQIFRAAADAAGVGEEVVFDQHRISLRVPFARMTMAEAILHTLQAHNADCPQHPLEAALVQRTDGPADGDRHAALARWAARRAQLAGKAISGGEGEARAMSPLHLIGFVFDKFFADFLVQPAFVYGYPIEMSPLARKNEKDGRMVDRFELFIAGMEMANAFSELNDPDDQRERFQAQVQNRQAGDDEAMDYDEDYVRALEHGMPPTGGLGIGIDRLVMVLCNQLTIRDVVPFPAMRPESDGGPAEGSAATGGDAGEEH